MRPERTILAALPNLIGQGAQRPGVDNAIAHEAVVKTAPDRAAKKARPAIKAGVKCSKPASKDDSQGFL